ncbi:hypothetical protein [Halobaculum litoreum]|uniref:Lipoprotein n=1 Tax=Halobaculum litoreum TaxID=3031998 RepID=A0ABD5XMG2_9EURY|nr:hypothetical protein [Halobaculum sp. DT92]
MRRRAFCSSLAFLVGAGCAARRPAASDAEGGDCDDARLLKTNRWAEQSSDDGVPYEDYVSVGVAVTGPEPPDLLVAIEVADGVDEHVLELDGLAADADREERWDGFEFGPFGHHTVGDVRASLVGCDESIP